MPNVEFKNITVIGECKCDTVENLACDDSRKRRSIPILSCEETKEKLQKATFCKILVNRLYKKFMS